MSTLKPYQFLSHTADLKIRAWGKTKKELFLNMMRAMEEAKKPEYDFNKPIERIITVNSFDGGTLLADFLNEVNYYNDVKQEGYQDGNFHKFTQNQLRVKLTGYKVKSFNDDIKAVTYHNLEIKKEKNLWQATVLFDI